MKVVYTETHQLHDPKYQIAGFNKSEYPEKPVRLESIAGALKEAAFQFVSPQSYEWADLSSVHATYYLTYLSNAYREWVSAGYSPDGVVPDTLPSRIGGQKTEHIANQAGWYCFDTSTPIVEHTFEAARASADCALTAADMLLGGDAAAYALCRPPGHHAGVDYCGGFCFLNNAALAAQRLLAKGPAASVPVKVAILDIDYHHGNGTQDIFYESDEVLFVSIHADPFSTYPHYWGFREEEGKEAGLGYNVNYPLPPGTEDASYLAILDQALARIGDFDPAYLIVSLGTDTYIEDPLGTFRLKLETFSTMGRKVSELHRPTLVIQEGGYSVDDLGSCVSGFLKSLQDGLGPP